MHIDVIILTTLPYRWPYGPTHSPSQWLTEKQAFSNQRPAVVKVRRFIAWKIFLTECKMFLTDALMNLMSVVSFLKGPLLSHRTFWLISLLCGGNVFCRIQRSKTEWGKNGNFLNPCRVFPLLCLCFDSLVCDGVSHTVVLQPTCPAPLCCWPLFEPVQL